VQILSLKYFVPIRKIYIVLIVYFTNKYFYIVDGSVPKLRTVHDIGFQNRKLLVPMENMQNPIEHKTLPTIFIITPTYKRVTQLADMTRLSNTLRNVKEIHWIVIEDGNKTSEVIENLLTISGVRYTYLHAPKYANVTDRLKGIHQRNVALHWIRHYVNPQTTRGVFYFADDDNTYDIRLFEEVRKMFIDDF
jgi:hypothetical protein